MQIPIFNKNIARTNIRKAKIQYQNAQVEEPTAVIDLRKVINQAYSYLHTPTKRFVFAKINYEASQQLFYTSEKRYQPGLVNSFDYHASIATFNKAEFALIQARYDIIFRRKILIIMKERRWSINDLFFDMRS